MQNNPFSSGFTAGTLVHTKDGLVPIEKINVGDFVFSRADNLQNAHRLKRVLKVFAIDNREIKYIGYKNTPDPYERQYRLFVTLNQLFWVKDKKWIAASLLEGDWMGPSQLELVDGSAAYSAPTCVYRTSVDAVGWIADAGFEGEGRKFDFVNCKGLGNSYFNTKDWPIHDVDEGGDGDGYRYTATVYNLEVEDFHSYFVGEHGVLVKSA